MFETVSLSTGVDKKGKTWFALKLVKKFDSGKTYTECVFITQNIFDELSKSEKFKISCK